jgi:DNA-binding HxlR family transcriptional regulator
MQDKAKSAGTAGEDQKYEGAVLAHIIATHPTTLRLSDLLRELGDPEDFSERDAIERAVRELVKAGLLFRCEGAVLPTRAALYLSELGLA